MVDLSMRNIQLVFFSLLIAFYTSTPKVDAETNNIIHVVFIWLNEPGNQDHINQLISSTHVLRQIPEVLELKVGNSVESDRAIVDDSFDVGLYMVFDSTNSLERYLNHPTHVEAVKTTLQPLANKILVYDFVEQTQKSDPVVNK